MTEENLLTAINQGNDGILQQFAESQKEIKFQGPLEDFSEMISHSEKMLDQMNTIQAGHNRNLLATIKGNFHDLKHLGWIHISYTNNIGTVLHIALRSFVKLLNALIGSKDN